MPLKEVWAPHLGRTVKMGRVRPNTAPPFALRLTKYLKSSLPVPPATTNYRLKAMPALRRMYANDSLGDCVVAAGGHLRGVTSGNALGTPLQFTDAQIIHDYSAISGYVPGNPNTDNGCDENTAISYWIKTGFPDGVKLTGSLLVDPTDVNQLKTAVWLFENLMFGMAMPDAWISPFPHGDNFVWDVAGSPVDVNGHAPQGVDYTANGVVISTWALLGTLTWSAIAKYGSRNAGGEVHAILSPDMIAKGMLTAPNGLDWKTLIQDFNALGGNLPVPPDPPPGPGPGPGPTPDPSANTWQETVASLLLMSAGKRVSVPAMPGDKASWK